VPSSVFEPSSSFVPSSITNFFASAQILVCFSNYDSEDENPPFHAHLPLVGSIEHEPKPSPQLPIWVHIT
jgi:hypothetical protein